MHPMRRTVVQRTCVCAVFAHCSPVHTGAICRRIRWQLPFSVTVAEFGDYSIHCGQGLRAVHHTHTRRTDETTAKHHYAHHSSIQFVHVLSKTFADEVESSKSPAFVLSQSQTVLRPPTLVGQWADWKSFDWVYTGHPADFSSSPLRPTKLEFIACRFPRAQTKTQWRMARKRVWHVRMRRRILSTVLNRKQRSWI